jgi:hypothetical protein
MGLSDGLTALMVIEDLPLNQAVSLQFPRLPAEHPLGHPRNISPVSTCHGR